ncbi:MAG: class I SAM-dependent methyltransferase, partial [Chlorobi bacterium]|nr:class I SAM-dependent methyltransferase [Chlorobiota bacterium]
MQKKINRLEIGIFREMVVKALPENDRQYFDFDSYLYAYSMAQDFEIMEKYLIGYGLKRILDIGSGIGLTTWYLDRLGYEVVGCDIEPEKYKLNMQTKFCQSVLWNILEENGENLKYVSIFPDKLPFEKESFDAVLAYAVLEHIMPEHLEKWLGEIQRIIKKNGLIFIFKCPQKLALTEHISRTLKLGAHEILYTRHEVNSLLEKIGFREIHFKQKDFLPYFMG